MLETKPGARRRPRKALGAQSAPHGYVARRVLGQYDVFLPPDDDGLISSSARTWSTSSTGSRCPRDFRLWVANHEVTHRVQFGVPPWLRGYLGGLVDEYLASIRSRTAR